MQSFLILILVSLSLCNSTMLARTTRLSAAQVERQGSVSVSSGDTLQITGTGAATVLDPARIDFGGGVLILRNVHLESQKGMQISDYSLTVYAGQELHLENIWMEGGYTSIRCHGGRLYIVNSTIATWNKGIWISDAGSEVLVTGSNFCTCSYGIDHSAGALELRDCLFLTTFFAIRSQYTEGLVISDCSFQGNELCFDFTGDAPLQVNHCDFYGSRYRYFNTWEGGTVTLQNCHLDGGSEISNGPVIEIDPQDQPWVPRQQLLLSQHAEPRGDKIVLTMIGNRTVAGLPYRASNYQVELSNDPNDFSNATILSSCIPIFRIPLETQEHFFRARAYIGEW